jgi:lipopolysaccharide transport system ATP-binding protein
MSSIIKVEDLGKKYTLSHQRKQSYYALRDVMADSVRRWSRKIIHPLASRRDPDPTHEEFWALKDVSFEINEGDRVGIIGRNGAGKSTLLKILSRITDPTKGRITINGRVASLLEVGTGFHPELTGRENIYLNGSILGMSKSEIKRKFDEIVAFAEVEKFLDTPVKRYSSGMYVRLAFAVAAHLEPEILVVDEVLAVGDAQFQKKCLGKMEDVSKEGRTVLFVSHNMTALKSLCKRAIWLDGGKIMNDGGVNEVVSSYLENGAFKLTEQTWNDVKTAPGNDKVRLHRVSIVPDTEEINSEITVRTPLRMEFVFWNFIPGAQLNFTFLLNSIEGGCVLTASSPFFQDKCNLIRGTCRIPGNFLNDGAYRVTVMIVQDASVAILVHEDAIIFEVHDTDRVGWFGKWPGVVRPTFDWSVGKAEGECT